MRRACFIPLCLLFAASAARADLSVSAVRLGDHGDQTRFVMELSQSPAFRMFTLPDPYRVVIDLPALDWTLADVPEGRGLVSALRFGLFAPGTSRVVLDVKAPVGFKAAFVLPPKDGKPYRLVVDLVPVSREAFMEPSQRQPLVSSIPLPRGETAALPLPRPKPSPDDRPTIVVDAGHGGVDPGSTGPSGRQEKHLTLAYARELQKQLEASGRYRVALTRHQDIFLRLRDRIARARNNGGDLFISLHADAHARSDTRGASVYSLSETASDTEAEALAAKENKSDVIAGVDLSVQTEAVSKILIDLAQRETMNSSRNFANVLVVAIGKETRLLSRAHRYAGFAVLKSPTIPSVLVELGYLSNRQEEQLLHTKAHRRKLSAAILRAIDQFFKKQQAARGP